MVGFLYLGIICSVKLTRTISHHNMWSANSWKFQNPRKHYFTQPASLLLNSSLCFLTGVRALSGTIAPKHTTDLFGTFAPHLPTVFFSWSLRSQLKYHLLIKPFSGPQSLALLILRLLLFSCYYFGNYIINHLIKCFTLSLALNINIWGWNYGLPTTLSLISRMDNKH